VDRTLQCDCGFTARAKDEDGLVAEVQRHAYEAHRMTLSHDDALLLAFRAELDTNPPSTMTHKPATPIDEEER
jgi:uncharacterized protein DUF1059